MAEKIPILPPDPVEAVLIPISGVDAPETDETAPDDRHPKRKQPYPENEGLKNTATPEAGEPVEGAQRPAMDEAEKAALRGHTA